MLKWSAKLCLLLLFAGNCIAAEKKSLTIVTEHNPPYNYSEDTSPGLAPKIKGFSTEIISEILNRTKINASIKLYPWKRAYRLAQLEENVLIYSIRRTYIREDQFKWVGPLANHSKYLYRLNHRTDIVIGSLEDAKRHAIGGEEDSATIQYLLNQGFTKGPNLQIAYSKKLNLKKLLANRIDLIAGTELGISYLLKLSGLNLLRLDKAYALPNEGDYYMAFSLATQDSIITQFQQALDEIKRDGTYKLLQDKYLL